MRDILIEIKREFVYHVYVVFMKRVYIYGIAIILCKIRFGYIYESSMIFNEIKLGYPMWWFSCHLDIHGDTFPCL